MLICRKCLKRSSEAKDIRRELKRAIKRRGDGNLKAAKLVTTSCFGICPKRAVTLASATSLVGGAYVLVSHGDDVEAALNLLQSPDRP